MSSEFESSRLPAEPLNFQLQIALPFEELGPRNSLHELRRMIVRVEDMLNLADLALSLLEPIGWRLLTVRFDDELAVILGRTATMRDIVADIRALPERVTALIGQAVRLCATLDDQVIELELEGSGLKPVMPARPNLTTVT